MKAAIERWSAASPSEVASRARVAVLLAIKDAKKTIMELADNLAKAETAGYYSIGPYTITRMGSDTVWIENADGEGMQAPAADIEKLLATYFTANF